MNIEQAIDILKNSIADYVIGEYCEKCADNKICDDRNEDCYYQQAIDTVITAYENLKSYNKGTKEALRSAEELERQANKEAGDWKARCFELQQELEKEKEKNKELYNPSDMILRYFDNKKGMQVEIKGFISKDKIKEIIKPTPENGIPIEIQQSDMYKKLLKEVEE
ncbi:MAG TPA: hypothetical protein DEP51_04085 [Clostridiales bacterium]|nr:hypothetical protein [Clostridiales bacterium]